MSKSKKVTFNTLYSDMQKDEINAIQFMEHEITVKRTLTLKEMIEFVSSVVHSCYDMDDGSYSPEIFEMAFMIYTLVHYAGMEVPKDINKAYMVVVGTDLFDLVCKYVNHAQLGMIKNAAEKRLEFVREKFVSAAVSETNYLIEKVDSMIEESTNVFTSFGSKEFQDTLNAINSVANPHVNEAAAIPSHNIIELPRNNDGDV